MKLFSWLTGGAKSADTILSGMVNGIDALVYTDEEKAIAGAENQKVWLEIQKVVANESTPRSINRRVVAWSVVGMVSLITILSMVLIVMGEKDLAAEIVKVADALGWPYAFIAVLIFYFGNHMITRAKGS